MEFLGVKSSGGNTTLPIAKQQLLNLLHENEDRYSPDNINRLQSLLTSKNIALDNYLKNYLKRYDNQVSLDFLDSLSYINLRKTKTANEQPEPVMWYGYYADK